jgi:hypothetical protein
MQFCFFLSLFLQRSLIEPPPRPFEQLQTSSVFRAISEKNENKSPLLNLKLLDFP